MVLEKVKSMQAGTKNTKKSCKLGKVKFPKRNTMNSDFSNLRKPVDTSISTLYHISKLLEESTEEVKSILSYECDIIYECRICRSLFRSIVNLLSHKREYCKEKFNITLHKNTQHDFNTISSIGSAIHTCQTEKAIMKIKNDRILRSQVSKKMHKKDLSAVVETLIKKREENMESFSNESEIGSVITNVPNTQHIYLKAIDTNSCAVYQSIESPSTVNVNDLIAKKINIENIVEQDNTMSEEHENQLEKNDSFTQADVNEEENKLSINNVTTNGLICTICNTIFSTKKTLSFHIKTLHTSQRVSYTCPRCTNTFANTWSVHRHLFKVHKISHKQLRKLRSEIQEIPFDKEVAAMQDLKKTRLIKASALVKIKHNTDFNTDKAQEKMLCLESDVEDLSCNKCDKSFDTNMALSAHLQYCQAATKISWSDKTPSDSVVNNNTLCELKNTDTTKDTSDTKLVHTSLSSKAINDCHEIDTCVQTISIFNEEEYGSVRECYNNLLEHNSTDNNNATTVSSMINQDIDDIEPPVLEPIGNLQSFDIAYQDTREMSSLDLEIKRVEDGTLSNNVERQPDLKEINNIEVRQNNSEPQPLRLMQPNEIELTSSIENKIATISDFQVYNAQNNRVRLAEVIVEMQQSERDKCKEDVVMNAVNVEEKIIEFDTASEAGSSSLSEICESLSDSSDTQNEEAATMKEQGTDLYKNEEATATKEHAIDSYKNEEASMQKERIGDLCGNVPIQGSGETVVTCTNLEEYMATNRTSGKLDTHPDLKRMVMEIILGSNDADGAAKQTDSKKSTSDSSNGTGKDTSKNTNKNNTVSINNVETTHCSTTDNSKLIEVILDSNDAEDVAKQINSKKSTSDSSNGTGKDTNQNTNKNNTMYINNVETTHCSTTSSSKVIEVILDSDDADDAAKQTDSKKSTSDSSNGTGKDTSKNTNKNNTVSINNVVTTHCSTTDNSKVIEVILDSDDAEDVAKQINSKKSTSDSSNGTGKDTNKNTIKNNTVSINNVETTHCSTTGSSKLIEVILHSNDAEDAAKQMDSKSTSDSNNGTGKDTNKNTIQNNTVSNNNVETTHRSTVNSLDLIKIIFGPDNADNSVKQMDSKKNTSDPNNETGKDTNKNTNKNNTVSINNVETTHCSTTGSLKLIEVILDSDDAEEAAKQMDSKKSTSDSSNGTEKDTNKNTIKNNTVSINNVEMMHCSTTGSLKPQRPMRKRIKPLNDDFIYDLKEMQLRKGPLQLSKSSAKHQLNLCDSRTLASSRKKIKLHNKAVNSNR